MRSHFLITGCFLLSFFPVRSQIYFDAPATRIYNFSSFNTPSHEITNELESLTPDSLYTHPEFGTLPFNAPCTDCIELLQNRSANTRMFVEKGTNGRKFYSQAGYQDLHYQDENGAWITIDPHLHPSAFLPGVFLANQQSNPTTLNLVEGYTAMRMQDGAELRFNAQITAYSSADTVTLTDAPSINRSVYTAGSDGAVVRNAFADIDQELRFDEAMIKSSYILQSLSGIDTSKDFFIIQDVFDLPEGYSINYDPYEGHINDKGFWHGDLVITNASGIEMARYIAPVMFDNNASDSTTDFDPADILSYIIDQSGRTVTLKLVADMYYLTNPGRSFPIVIDPTVYGTTTTWTGTSGTDDSPTFCNIVVSVPTPANATLTGSSVYWEFVASGTACTPFCKLKYMQVRIGTTCGYSPSAAGVWVCPLCNTAGTWNPTVDDATTAALVSCFTPQCASFNINFTIYHNQYQCVTAGGCVTTCDHMDKVTITVRGETLAATALAEGATAYTVVNCADQSGWLSASTPNYGVPAYTYTWSPGGYTFSPVYVIFPMGTTTYTLTMTDACGNTVTDNVVVTNNCLTLPIQLLSFTGQSISSGNMLNWEVDPTMINKSFSIEKSLNGKDFSVIGNTEPNSNVQSQFTFIDDHVEADVTYYRLHQVDQNGEDNYSNVISIQREGVTDALVINQYDTQTGNLSLTVFTPASGPATLSLYDISSRLIGIYPLQVTSGATSVQLQLPLLPAGTYLLSIQGPGLDASARLVR